ncbi:MAG: hypothetical protein IKD72_00025 [Clostridia bacterium]|nr:hypothetical protein [Clostridia bacterium]
MGKYKRLLQEHENLKTQLEQLRDQLTTSGSRNQLLQTEANTLRQLLTAMASESEKLESELTAARREARKHIEDKKVGQCDGCMNRKVTQRCASCTRNPHAIDKFAEDPDVVKTKVKDGGSDE